MKKVKILYRKNLKMSPGKLATQAVHAATGLGVDDYSLNVVVLGLSDTKFFEKHMELLTCYPAVDYWLVCDAGHTELPPATETCLAYYEETDETTKILDNK